jgi:hypothetical protein
MSLSVARVANGAPARNYQSVYCNSVHLVRLQEPLI